VLYDLFVAKNARRRGIAKALLNAAKDLGIQSKAAWLERETGITNRAGQSLYETMGWERGESMSFCAETGWLKTASTTIQSKLLILFSLREKRVYDKAIRYQRRKLCKKCSISDKVPEL